jgi:phosphoenolpyruvate carboxykinase (GTP)
VEGAKLPRIFYVNWFRKDQEGKFIWPGFGENSRVLAWIFRRCDDAADYEDTPIGRVPTAGALPTDGLDLSEDDLAQLVEVDHDEWKKEVELIREHYKTFGDKLPGELTKQVDALEERLSLGLLS